MYFTVRGRQPVSMVILSEVSQGKKENIQAHIDRFTKAAVSMGRTDENLKCWIFKTGRQPNNIFIENLGYQEALSPNNMLRKDQAYVKYEEKLLADGGGKWLSIPEYRRMADKEPGKYKEYYERRPQ